MEILYNFGFQPILFFAQIVNFLIIYLVLKKYLYKPVLKILQDRRQQIEEGIKKAEESARLLEETVQKEEKILKEAQEKAKKLIEEAKAQRDAIIKQTEEDTKKQVDAMLQEARSQIAYETKLAEKRIAINISKIAVEFLEKSLHDLFGEKEQEVVIKNAIKQIKSRVD